MINVDQIKVIHDHDSVFSFFLVYFNESISFFHPGSPSRETMARTREKKRDLFSNSSFVVAWWAPSPRVLLWKSKNQNYSGSKTGHFKSRVAIIIIADPRKNSFGKFHGIFEFFSTGIPWAEISGFFSMELGKKQWNSMEFGKEFFLGSAMTIVPTREFNCPVFDSGWFWFLENLGKFSNFYKFDVFDIIRSSFESSFEWYQARIFSIFKLYKLYSPKYHSRERQKLYRMIGHTQIKFFAPLARSERSRIRKIPQNPPKPPKPNLIYH